MTTQHTPDQIHDLANKLERDPSEWGGVALGWKAAARLRELQARIADLESQLYAIGAGGVGASIQPQAQQEPVGYMRWKNGSAEYVTRKHLEHPDDESWHAVYTAPQPTENLKCKSTQKRLATLWGYVKKEPDHFRDAAQMVSDRQPLTNEQIIAIADNARAAESGDAGYILPIAFARAIEAAVNGSQQ